MNGVIQFNSRGKFVRVLLKNGGGYGEVKIYPDIYTIHILGGIPLNEGTAVKNLLERMK